MNNCFPECEVEPVPSAESGLGRYWILNFANGNDLSKGYIDAVLGSQFTPAQTTPIALKTFEGLRAKMARNGEGSIAVVLIAPTGPYLNQAGGADFLDIGYTGYQFLMFRGSDLTNSADDLLNKAGVQAVVGPETGGAFEVSAYSASPPNFQVTVSDGTGLPASSNALAGLRMRWEGNITAALANEGNLPVERIDGTNFLVGFDGTSPVNGDLFHLERPGVQVAGLRGQGNYASSNFSGAPAQGMVIAGIEFTASVNLRTFVGRIRGSFLRFSNSCTLSGCDLEVSGTTPTEAGGFAVTAVGIDCHGSFNHQHGKYSQVQVSAWHGATCRWTNIAFLNIGEGSYALPEPSFRGCGLSAGPGDTSSIGSTVGSANPSGKPGWFLEAGLEMKSSNANIAGLDFITAGVPGLTVVGPSQVGISGLRGDCTYAVDMREAIAAVAVFGPSSGMSVTAATADVIGNGIGTKAFADLDDDHFVDDDANLWLGDGGYVTPRYRAGTICNAPIVSADPTGNANGDVWVYDDGGGTRELRVNIGGTVRAATLA